MKKSLLLLALTILSNLAAVTAQTLFEAPDTVCINQPVHLNSKIFGAESYYWGFCSGDISNAPTGNYMGNSYGFHSPSNIDIIKDVDGKYYGFVLNASTDELLRLNFGASLANVPTVTNFGNLDNGLPHHPTSLYIVRDSANAKWFVFVSGGYTASESTIGRVDFGASLSNPAPNVANFGLLGGNFNGPRGIFVAKDANSQWYGYVVNRNDNNLIRMNFGFNVSFTPSIVNLGNPGGALNGPTDMAAVKDGTNWYLFATNYVDDAIVRVDLGTQLESAAPAGTNLGNFVFRVLKPSSISLTKDCGSIFAYITDSTTSQLISLEMTSAVGPYTAVNYAILGGMNFPSGISSIMRDKDDLYAFAVNTGDSSLTRLDISHCTNTTIPSFTEVTPPVYTYNQPGLYNVYYVINDGRPDMQVECKEIRVLPIPNIVMNTNNTICQRDVLNLYAVSNSADSFKWSPYYNIDTTYNNNDTVKVWPDFTTQYNVQIFYPTGCIVDTHFNVNVIKVSADAGPDRSIADGADVTLGGPNTSLNDYFNSPFTYTWIPNTFMATGEDKAPFPTINPTNDITYYLEVRTESGCVDRDTVTITLNCGDIYVPNAFRPTSGNAINVGASSTFGILNHNIIQLNYFKIYDRWGKEVFTTTNPSEKWDGYVDTKLAQEGVYVYIIDGFCASGKPVHKQGNVTLLR